MTDWQLLRKFADDNSQAAFAEICRRYTNLVYRVCQRELGETTLAEDAAQAVFLLLARKAPSLKQSRADASLSAWLFQAALLTAKNARRQEQRRQAYELEAAQMQTQQPSTPPEWAEVEPLLNDALQALPPGQRMLILERFFDERSLVEIGASQGISEDAARMRVNRALDRLHRWFTSRNIALSAAALAALLPQAVRPAPAHAAEAIACLSLPTSSGTPASILAQGVLDTMNLNLLKLQIGAAALVAVFVLGTAGAVRVTTQMKAKRVAAARLENQAQAHAVLDQMYATYAAMKSFHCEVTSREDELGTAQDAEYEIEQPNKIRFRRVTMMGVEDLAKAQAVSDGKNLYVTSTEPSRYAKMSLESPVDPSLLYTFGGLGAWGTEPLAGMPAVALGGDKENNIFLTSTDYSLGQPVTMNPSMINEHNVSDSVADVVIVTKHILFGTIDSSGKIDPKTGKDVPSTITYYIGQRDHLLYKMTAAYPCGFNQANTRTETYADQDINPKLPASDFVFTPPPGSHAVPDTSDLSSGGRK